MRQDPGGEPAHLHLQHRVVRARAEIPPQVLHTPCVADRHSPRKPAAGRVQAPW
jgi:hypothetical protein